MELTREEILEYLDKVARTGSETHAMAISDCCEALRTRLAACEQENQSLKACQCDGCEQRLEDADAFCLHCMTTVKARVQALEQEQARLRATLVKIAKPALGGKQQQQWAREALKGG